MDLEGGPAGASFLAMDVADAGEGDMVLVMREGGSARIVFNDEQIPVQAVIVGVVDRVEWDPDLAKQTGVAG